MRIETFGSIRARVAGGADREGGGDGPVVVLMHGFGAPGDDLASLWRVIDAPRGTRFVFPEAPIALDAYGSGRAWWMIDTERLERAMARGELRDMSREVPDGLEAVRAAALAMIGDIEKKLGAETIVLGGFSQGAMLALDAAIHADARPAALVLLSGTLMAEEEWTPLLPRLAGVPIFMSHGRSDALLGFPFAERLRGLLERAGANVEWHPFAGGHEIPPAVLDAVGPFLRRALGA